MNLWFTDLYDWTSVYWSICLETSDLYYWLLQAINFFFFAVFIPARFYVLIGLIH